MEPTRGTEAVPVGGRISQLLQLVANADPGSRSAVEDEVVRFCRALDQTSVARSLSYPPDVADALDYIAALLEEDSVRHLPPHAAERLTAAAGGAGEAEYLRTLAQLVRLASEDDPVDYRSLPMSGWETRVRYPDLFQYGVVYDLVDEYPGGIAEYLAVHCLGEECRDRMAALIAQVQDALVRFPTDGAIRANFTGSFLWATTETLTEFDSAARGHLAQEHQEDYRGYADRHGQPHP